MVISIASQKGGVGKTSTAISLSAGVARSGQKVLLIDVDPQANSSKVLIENYADIGKSDTTFAPIIEREAVPYFPTSVPNLHIAPSHILLSEATLTLTVAKDHREARLKTQIDAIKDDYDYIFIDCPPSLDWLTLNAFTASDRIVVVVAPGFFELDSLVQLGKVVEEVQKYYNSRLKLWGFLFAMSDTTVSSRESLKILRQTYTDLVFKTVIPRNVAMRDANFEKQDVFAYELDSKAAQAYQKLIEEIGLGGNHD